MLRGRVRRQKEKARKSNGLTAAGASVSAGFFLPNPMSEPALCFEKLHIAVSGNRPFQNCLYPRPVFLDKGQHLAIMAASKLS